ncbi:glycosyltransferase [Microcella sp.]|uniref:glycosyltransferase n=1 Tax=Microcella sp. TaxID=1913979 RepID=UPI003F715A74
MADASISVAMCTRNGAQHVARQVQSILRQRPAPIELVVGDDDSSDDTLAIIERVHAEEGGTTRLTIIRRRPPLGVTANFAATLAACSGDLIALSDQDDEWMPGKLVAHAAAFAADPGLLLVHSDARLVDGEGAPLGSTLLEALEATPAERAGLAAGEGLPVLLRRNLVTGATVVLRRSLLEHAAPIPAEWVHDEWLAAIAAAVGRMRLLPEPLIDYRQHGANEIGARRPTMSDRLARLREPRAERAARLAHRTALLAARGRAIGVSAEAQRLLDAKADHEARRARLPRVRLARVPAVLGGALTGRYSRYSRGAMDVLRDLVTPAGELPVMTLADAAAPTDRGAA